MKRLAAVVLAGFIATGCERVEDAPEPALRDTTAQQPVAAPSEQVEVRLLDAQGAEVGTAHLTQQGDSVDMHVVVQGLQPGEHGIHFHENALCEAPTFESAGGHFNPTSRQHGLENPQGPHAGDLPNLVVGADGRAEQSFRIGHPRTGAPGMAGDTMGMAGDTATAHGGDGGLALVIHADRDDQRTDPSGNSGDRIACGVARIQ